MVMKLPYVRSIAPPLTRSRRPFRWTLVPAVVCWFGSAVLAFMVAVALVSPPARGMRALAAEDYVASAVVWLFCICPAVAGFRWLSGRWKSALTLSLLSAAAVVNAGPLYWILGTLFDAIYRLVRLVPRLAKSDELLLQATYHDSNVHDSCHTSFDKLGWGGF